MRGSDLDQMFHSWSRAQSNALKELVEGEGGQQGANCAGRVADAERNADEHRVEGDAGLQHLWAHAAAESADGSLWATGVARGLQEFVAGMFCSGSRHLDDLSEAAACLFE